MRIKLPSALRTPASTLSGSQNRKRSFSLIEDAPCLILSPGNTIPGMTCTIIRGGSHLSTMPPKKKYTDPKLRDEVKEEVQQGDRGGAPGKCSARKVQLSTPPALPLHIRC